MWQKCQFPNFEIQNFTIVPCQNWHERSQFNLLHSWGQNLISSFFIHFSLGFRLFCWQGNFSDVKLAINQYSCLKWSIFGWNTFILMILQIQTSSELLRKHNVEKQTGLHIFSWYRTCYVPTAATGRSLRPKTITWM